MENNIEELELLSPVGSYDSLISAVQNGASAVYFGSTEFNARNFASNFNNNTLKKAIAYAKIRNVKTYLTLNTLIKDNEIINALDLVNTAYSYGIDAIIVQDIGFATVVKKYFPDLPLHASTQMVVHNLEGVKQLESLGFSRVVLARELTIDEISYICKNTNVEIECFVHGALCVSYSGQCLFSSLIGQRSGNRGKCAQACRLPYKLYNNNEFIRNGYLLSTKDLCTINNINELKNAGIKSLKIEGRMKSPEYVAITTRLYRKAIKKETVTDSDIENLTQMYNRGNFTTGYLFDKQNIIYDIKPKNLGIYLGKILKYITEKGLIEIKLEKDISIGDGIETLDMEGSTIVSEIFDENNSHIEYGKIGQTVKLGRIKGNLKVGHEIYKTSCKKLNIELQNSFNGKEYKRIGISIKISIKNNTRISLFINNEIEYTSDIIADKSINLPLSKETLINQFKKTNNFPFEIENLEIDLDDNLFLPLSSINKLRNEALNKYYIYQLDIIGRKNVDRNIYVSEINNKLNILCKSNMNLNNDQKNIYIYLNNISEDSLSIQHVKGIYIPYRIFINSKYTNILSKLCLKQKVYISLPNISKQSLIQEFSKLQNMTNFKSISGIMISNYSQYEIVKSFNLEIHGNYTLNTFNNITYEYFSKLNIRNICISPELNKNEINIFNTNSQVICYGRIKCMTIQNCIIKNCKSCPNNSYRLIDRLNYSFPIITDNTNCTTNIFNSKMLSFNPQKILAQNIRLDFINESIDEIKNIISQFKINNNPEGNNYTNGHFNKII